MNPLLDCPFCKITARHRCFNPFTHSGPNVNPYKALKQHMGICPQKGAAIAKAKRTRDEISHPQEISDQVVQPLIHHNSLLPKTKQSKPSNAFNDDVNFILAYEEDFNMIDVPALQARVTQSSLASSSSSMQQDTSSSSCNVLGEKNNGLPRCLMLEGDVEMAANVAYEQQQKLVDTYSSKTFLENELNIRASPGYSEDSKLRLEDFVDIAKWLEKSTISMEDGDSLFGLINRILKRHGLHHMLHFPAQTETIIKSLSKNAEELHSIIDIEIPFPVE